MKHLIPVLLLGSCLAFAQATAAKDAKKKEAKPAAAVKAEAAKPEPKKETKSAKKAEAATGFVANSETKVFHTAGCKVGAKMKAENKTSFASKAEAEKQGFKACKVCKP